MNEVQGLIMAITALVAVIISPIVTFAVLRRQIRTSLDIARVQITADLVSANRQQWINTLRDTLAELLALLWASSHASSQGAMNNEQVYQANLRAGMMLNKIRLLLNPKEQDHSELIKVLPQILQAADSMQSIHSPASIKAFDDLESHIIALMQAILKREWERVKTVQ
jgi:hypothetical protein